MPQLDLESRLALTSAFVLCQELQKRVEQLEEQLRSAQVKEHAEKAREKNKLLTPAPVRVVFSSCPSYSTK